MKRRRRRNGGKRRNDVEGNGISEVKKERNLWRGMNNKRRRERRRRIYGKLRRRKINGEL